MGLPIDQLRNIYRVLISFIPWLQYRHDVSFRGVLDLLVYCRSSLQPLPDASVGCLVDRKQYLLLLLSLVVLGNVCIVPGPRSLTSVSSQNQ